MKKIVFAFLVTTLYVAANAQVSIGQQAPEITLPNAKDSAIHLSSFKGKVVMIDFWASWCGPCRESNPAVVRLYKKYKDKGFEVFGVSIDAKKSLWLKAVKKDKLTYTQVNDKDGFDSKAAEKYGVDQIPTTFLLDKNGIISAIDLEGTELEEMVKELLAR